MTLSFLQKYRKDKTSYSYYLTRIKLVIPLYSSIISPLFSTISLFNSNMPDEKFEKISKTALPPTLFCCNSSEIVNYFLNIFNPQG